MTIDAFDFDQMKTLAESDPTALEDARKSAIESLIDSAPEKYRRRLRGLQFQIDMAREKAKTPMASCIAISNMMHDSFDDLKHSLNELAEAGATLSSSLGGFESMGMSAEAVSAEPIPSEKFQDNANTGQAAQIIPFKKMF